MVQHAGHIPPASVKCARMLVIHHEQQRGFQRCIRALYLSVMVSAPAVQRPKEWLLQTAQGDYVRIHSFIPRDSRRNGAGSTDTRQVEMRP